MSGQSNLGLMNQQSDFAAKRESTVMLSAVDDIIAFSDLGAREGDLNYCYLKCKDCLYLFAGLFCLGYCVLGPSFVCNLFIRFFIVIEQKVNVSG